MGKPRAWTRLSTEAIASAAREARSASHLARLLGIDGSTARRWVSSKRVTLGGRPLAVVPPMAISPRDDASGRAIVTEGGAMAINAALPQDADAWRDSVLRTFELTADENMLLLLAHRHLAAALNPATDAATVSTATLRYLSLRKALKLPEEYGEAIQTKTTARGA